LTMDQNQLTGFGGVSSGSHSLRDSVNRDHLNGLAAILVGVSQLPLAVMFADVTGYESSLFVIGAGGFLLIAIGVNVFRGMGPFEVDWIESERVTQLSMIINLVIAVVVAAAAFLILV
jgi:hypothetical protein